VGARDNTDRETFHLAVDDRQRLPFAFDIFSLLQNGESGPDHHFRFVRQCSGIVIAGIPDATPSIAPYDFDNQFHEV
jgi:hypothetical protein